MHFVISGTWGPTDPTRAMLPFIFAASAVQDGDTVTLMLFHDAILMAVDGAGAKLVPVGPPNRYEEVLSHPNVILWACRPCVDARGLDPSSLDRRVKLGGMNEFHPAAKQPADARRHYWRAVAVQWSVWVLSQAATSASTACPNSVLAPLRKTSVSGSENVPGWVS